MWILWLVFIVNGAAIHSPLHSFPSKALCKERMADVRIEIQRSYPDDKTMRMYCRRMII